MEPDPGAWTVGQNHKTESHCSTVIRSGKESINQTTTGVPIRGNGLGSKSIRTIQLKSKEKVPVLFYKMTNIQSNCF